MSRIFLLLITILTATLLVAAQDAAPVPSPTPEIGQTINSGPGFTNLPLQRPFTDILKTNGYVRPDAATRRKRFVNSIVGPVALGKAIATAGISTWRNDPEEWGPKWNGFGRRFASNVGKNTIKQSTKFGLDEALKYDSHFYRSRSKRVSDRFVNAVISPVTARDVKGKRVVGIPNLVGSYGANVVAYETWYPSRYSWKDGIKTGTISLGFTAAFNLFKEFVWKK